MSKDNNNIGKGSRSFERLKAALIVFADKESREDNHAQKYEELKEAINENANIIKPKPGISSSDALKAVVPNTDIISYLAQLNEKKIKHLSPIQWLIGVAYRNGFGVDKDIKRALEWWQKAAELGNANANLDIARCYYYGQEGIAQNYKTAAEYLQEAAALNDPTAISTLAYLHQEGLGVEKNLSKAVELYQKAADLEDRNAMYNLAVCYTKGKGIDKDLKKAVEWYQKAADLGDRNAMLNLAICYENGKGIEKDLEKAMEWYQKAAELGNADAMFILALHYKNGEGIDKDIKKAVEWFQKAAELDDADAMNNLGSCYRHGHGVPKDPVKALFWYQSAVYYDHPTAHNKCKHLLDKWQDKIISAQKKITGNTPPIEQCRQYMYQLSGFSLWDRTGEKLAFQFFINGLPETELFKMLGGLKREELQNVNLFNALCNRPGRKMIDSPLKTITKDNEGKRIYTNKPFTTSDNQTHDKIPGELDRIIRERIDVLNAMDTLSQWGNTEDRKPPMDRLPNNIMMEIMKYINHGSVPMDTQSMRESLSKEKQDSKDRREYASYLESQDVSLKERGEQLYKDKKPGEEFNPTALKAIKKTDKKWAEDIKNQKGNNKGEGKNRN